MWGFLRVLFSSFFTLNRWTFDCENIDRVCEWRSLREFRRAIVGHRSVQGGLRQDDTGLTEERLLARGRPNKLFLSWSRPKIAIKRHSLTLYSRDQVFRGSDLTQPQIISAASYLNVNVSSGVPQSI